MVELSVAPTASNVIGPLGLDLALDSEIILKLKVQSGFAHKNIERIMSERPWSVGILLAGHLDPEARFFGELSYVLAVESLLRLPVPPRAKNIRLILSELTRICSHLQYLQKLTISVGATPVFHYVSRDREGLLDLFELISGSRYCSNFMRITGVAADITEGFVERVTTFCHLIRIRIDEFNQLFTYDDRVVERLQGLARIERDWVEKFGLTGLAAKACGFSVDARRNSPYTGYELVGYQSLEVATAGDAHARLIVCLREILQSVEILDLQLGKIAPGHFRNLGVDYDLKLPDGKGESWVESARGTYHCEIESKQAFHEGKSPAQVRFDTPSNHLLLAVPEILRYETIEDLEPGFASLNFNVLEVDK